MKWIYVALMSMGWLSADSINLFNDSPYMLNAIIYDANGTVMGEFTLNTRDANEWSNNDQNFGTESMYASQTPYTVKWSCTSGMAYGSCDNVAAGSTVTAQGCGGDQECTEAKSNKSTNQILKVDQSLAPTSH